MGIWEENRSRQQPPGTDERSRGNGVRRVAVSESRREMIRRGELFGVPSFRWFGPDRIDVEYWIVCRGSGAFRIT
jgi:hypothetical protein